MTLPSVKQAFLWHFAISLAVFIVLVFLMMTFWFPDDLFFMDGGWQGLKIIAPIDLVLGPALTLIFYRPWKPNLKIDMTTIAVVQIAALGFGVYSAYQQRTAAIVFAENRFETLTYSEFNSASAKLLERKLPAKSIGEFGSMPILVYAEPFLGESYGEYLADILNGLPELRERSDRYIPLSQARDKIVKHKIDDHIGGITEIPASSPATSAAAPNESYIIKARYFDGSIIFDGENFTIKKDGS